MRKETRLLMVDDDPAIVQMFSEILRSGGCQVWEASNGQQALEITRARRPDVVLLDVMLPGLSGLDVCRQIKADPALSDVFVVLFSGHATDSSHRVEGLEVGADDYIARPLPRDEFLARIRTIVRLQHATADLRASNERFRQIAENIFEVFWLTDPLKNEMVYVSPAYEPIWGRTCASLYASPRNWLEAIHPSDRSRVLEAALTKQVCGQYDEIYRIVRPDGSIRWIHDRAVPIRDPAGKVFRVAGTAMDITQRYQAQEALREAEARYRSIVDNATEGIFRNTPQGRLLSANPAMIRMFGYESLPQALSTITNIGTQIYVRPERRAELMQLLQSQGSVKGFEAENYRKDGRKIWTSLNVHVVRDAGGSVLYYEGTCQNITDRKRFEEELRQFPRRIMEAQEAERQRVARDLHDSVNQLIASARMRLRKAEESGTAFRPSTREILARCHDLLVQALEENRRIAHDLRPSELDEFGFTVACRSFCRQFQALTNLVVSCRIGRLGQRLDSAAELHLFRIVQEALNNVHQHARAKNVRLRVECRDSQLRLSIQDDGRGFRPNRPRPAGRKRHGIGLSNIRERAAALGGVCEIQSVPGHSTTLMVTLPVAVRSS